MTIELRLSDVDPPAPEPPRTIYRDVLNLPDPVKLGLTVRYFNHDDVGLYMQITAAGTGYTFGTVNLGLLGSGANAYQNLDEFGSRAKPTAGEFSAGEFEETVTLTLKGYTDSGYTNLKWTFERTVTIHWIKSDDAAWTQDVLNNFDDGTVQGWAVANEAGNAAGYPQLAVVTDYVLSSPYSIRMTQYLAFDQFQGRARLYKSFTTPNKDKVFAILDIRNSANPLAQAALKNVILKHDGTILIFLGKPFDPYQTEFIPRDKWMRLVAPLPKNVTIEVRVVQEYKTPSEQRYAYLWLDDFKIISK